MSDHDAMDEVLEQARGALQGERVRLRELRDDDLPQLVAWWRAPEVARFNDRVQPRPDAPVREMFVGWSGNDSAAGAGFCVETLDGELVGHVALWGAEGVSLGSGRMPAPFRWCSGKAPERRRTGPYVERRQRRRGAA